MLKEAILWEKLEDNTVRCVLCSHRCKIKPSKFGICGMRQNQDGVLQTFAYGKSIAANVDPIEKKPIYHLLPGSSSFSIATMGCNFKCDFCQNWQISQLSITSGGDTRGYDLPPETVVAKAKEHGCKSIAYTYTEPTIFFEYAKDTGKLAKKEGLYNIFVTNGFMTHEALDDAVEWLDACNVDLKSFQEKFYKNTCKGRLAPVLDSIQYMKDLNIWVEVTTLVVTDENDSKEELKEIAEFIASVDKNIPWHISRFHPDYKFTDRPPTPLKTLEAAYNLGLEAGLRYVYLGNVPGESNTICPGCKKTLIQRKGYSVAVSDLEQGRCASCGTEIAGIFK